MEITGESPGTGVYRLRVTGVEPGETAITVTATADGYTEAVGEIEVFVEDPFDLSLWRELVFDAFDCPAAASSDKCQSRWGERTVEDTITAVLPVQPGFHILTRAVTRRFTSRQIDTIEEGIELAVEQLTGEPFAGRITTGTRLKDQYGWVDVVPVGNAFFDRRSICGAANIGDTEGLNLINVELLDDCSLMAVAMHEIGHALGFSHVLDLGDFLMSPRLADIPASFTGTEQFHARLAWELGPGAAYTPDPRQRATTSYLTTDMFSPGAMNGIGNGPLAGAVQCPLH